ncbi:MAG: phosphatase PAP2 family protein [Longimicrobiales bacterium]
MIMRRHPLLDGVMRAITHLGDAAVTIGISLIALTGILPGGRAAGLRAALTLAISHGLVQLLKRIVSRPRPSLPVGLGFLIVPPDRFSFPSGHATSSLAVVLPFAFATGGVIALLLVVLALIVGLSRCYLGVHYPGDVVMGWILAVGTFGLVLYS